MSVPVKSFETSCRIVQDIWDTLSVGEQMRLLDLFKSPKAEPFREAQAIKRKSYRRDGPGSEPEKQRTMAVSAGKR